MAWRNCAASLALIDEVNKRWPNRSRVSDGTIGDAAHATRTSDHNPWVVVGGQGVVRARDITASGIDAPWLAEYLRGLGVAGDPRLIGGGYVIFNRRITTPDWRGWKTYTGINPHTHHVHVSFSRNQSGFDSSRPWGIWPATSTAAAPVEDDLPSPADVWQHPVPDEYTPNPNDGLPAFAALGFTLARVTWTLEQLQAVAGVVQRLETKVDRLQAGGGGAVTQGGLTEADKDDIATRVVNMLAARLDQ